MREGCESEIDTEIDLIGTWYHRLRLLKELQAEMRPVTNAEKAGFYSCSNFSLVPIPSPVAKATPQQTEPPAISSPPPAPSSEVNTAHQSNMKSLPPNPLNQNQRQQALDALNEDEDDDNKSQSIAVGAGAAQATSEISALVETKTALAGGDKLPNKKSSYSKLIEISESHKNKVAKELVNRLSKSAHRVRRGDEITGNLEGEADNWLGKGPGTELRENSEVSQSQSRLRNSHAAYTVKLAYLNEAQKLDRSLALALKPIKGVEALLLSKPKPVPMNHNENASNSEHAKALRRDSLFQIQTGLTDDPSLSLQSNSLQSEALSSLLMIGSESADPNNFAQNMISWVTLQVIQ
jgi:hypothetical protein